MGRLSRRAAAHVVARSVARSGLPGFGYPAGNAACRPPDEKFVGIGVYRKHRRTPRRLNIPLKAMIPAIFSPRVAGRPALSRPARPDTASAGSNRKPAAASFDAHAFPCPCIYNGKVLRLCFAIDNSGCGQHTAANHYVEHACLIFGKSLHKLLNRHHNPQSFQLKALRCSEWEE